MLARWFVSLLLILQLSVLIGRETATEDDKIQSRALVKQELAMSLLMERCVSKAVLSGVMGPSLLLLCMLVMLKRRRACWTGAGLGAFFSLMQASFRYEDPFAAPAMRDLRTSQKAAEMFKDMGKGMVKGGRQWGLLGLMFSGVECCIEGVSLSPSFAQIKMLICFVVSGET